MGGEWKRRYRGNGVDRAGAVQWTSVAILNSLALHTQQQ
jgi:hypothetical protein